MSLVGLTGYAGSGKDTAAIALIEAGWERMSFADPLRECMLILNPLVGPPPMQDWHCIGLRELVEDIGWDRAKREYGEVRRLLQVFGTEVVRDHFGRDAWVNIARDRMQPGVDYVFTDCRFPNEVEMIHRAGGLVFRVERAGVGPVNAHASDDIMGLHVDYVIKNATTVKQLQAKLRALVL